MKAFKNLQVKDVFSDYPPAYRKKLMVLRELIFEVAKSIEDKTGKIDETLKWGQPSYVPIKKGVGSTLRIHHLRIKPDQYGMYFNCQTKLIARIKRKFPGKFVIEGKRAIIFQLDDKISKKEIKECIEMSLTYHLNK